MNGKEFIRACSAGNIDKVNSAIELGIPVDTTDQHGLSGLIWASRKGRVKVAKLLLDAGADIDFPDVRKRTPVFHAVCFDKREMVELLAQSGANLDVIDCHRMTPCTFAELERNYELIELLKSFGAKSCSPKHEFLEMNIGLNGLNVKDKMSDLLAIDFVKKLRRKLGEIQIQRVDRVLESVCVVLVVGVELPLQHAEYENRTVSTEVGIPECDSQLVMNENVLDAVRRGYVAIGDFMALNYSEKFDCQGFRRATQAVFDSLPPKTQ